MSDLNELCKTLLALMVAIAVMLWLTGLSEANNNRQADLEQNVECLNMLNEEILP